VSPAASACRPAADMWREVVWREVRKLPHPTRQGLRLEQQEYRILVPKSFGQVLTFPRRRFRLTWISSDGSSSRSLMYNTVEDALRAAESSSA
jgi:hypothetical protein